MGGPIKQGIMDGIREPKKNGGKMLLVGQHPKEFRDKSGREKHWFPVLAWGANALRAAPMVWRGMKAARTLAPGKLGAWGRVKDVLGFGAPRYRATSATIKRGGPRVPDAQGSYSPVTLTPGKDMGILQALKDPKRFGMFLRERPLTSLTALTLPATAADLTRKHGADVAKGGWNLAKKYAAAVVPGDQSHWWEEPVTHDTVPGVPGGVDPEMYYDKTRKVKKELSESERKAFALKQRNERVNKYLDMMGYESSKKTAIADALIDASKIVGDRGTLDLKNIGQELISPIIQATSKRLDKPEQIREAVGLMATKAEIEKDLSAETDFLDKEAKRTQIALGKKNLERGFEKDMADFFLGSRTKPDKKQTETYARIKADEYGLPFKKVTNEELAKAPEGASETEIIQSVVGDDGIYMVGNAMVKVTGGVPKILIGA